MTRFHSITAALASLILLVACGGGAVTTPTPDPVTFADWVAGSGASDEPQRNDAGEIRNGFLQSENGDLMIGYTTGDTTTDLIARDDSRNNPLVQDLTFTAFGNGNTIEGGVQTFIGGVTGQASETSNYYAGVRDDTALGAPISDGRRDGAWSARLSFSSTIVPQFTVPTQLNVRFDNGGTVDASAQIQGDYRLTLNGTFNNRGVISGTVNFADTTTLPAINNNYVGTGVLSGLIGLDGAVGAFISDRTCPANLGTTCTGAYVGGFVALPPRGSRGSDTVVRYGDWERATGASSPTPTAGSNGFLQGDIGGVRFDNVDQSQRDSVDLGASRNGNPLGGDELDGVAFYQSGGNYYAALYSSTRLGLPLNSPSQAGTWNGVLGYIVSDIDPSRQDENRTAERDMTLNVNFERSTISADVKAIDSVASDLSFNLAGSFDYRGVITGTTTLTGGTGAIAGRTQGTLVGLIGQDGAVGAFISNAGQTRNPFAGGFVAAADRARDNTVNYGDWLELATQSPAPTPISPAGRKNQFLETAAGINARGDSVAEAGAAQGVLHFEGVFGGGDAADGVAYYQHSDRAFYAGVLSGTDLGANLSAGGTWNGRLEYVSGGAPISRELALDIDFSAGSISSFVKATTNANEQFYFNINGDFDGRGVISGTTTHGTYANGSASATPSGTTDGTLTGLIGAGGAVGAFVSNDGQPLKPYAGGFVAAPNPPHPLRDIVEYSDWQADITRFTSLDRTNQFVKDGPTGVRLADANTVNVVELNFEPGEGGIGGLRSYRRAGTVNGVDVGARYAGIFENTNVGPAIANNNLQGTWKGRLSLSRAESVIDPININLDVNFNTGTNSGTIDSFVKLYDDSRPLRLLIDGTFDSNGIISGDTTMADFSPNESTPVSISTPQDGPADRNYSEGVLSGLIGVNGAIGVFHSDTTTTGIKGYSGGFVAISPSFEF